MTDAPPSTEGEAAPEPSEEAGAEAPAKPKAKGRTFVPGTKAHGAKLWPRDWLEIYQMVRNGVPVWKIAKTYKIERSTIYRKLKAQNIPVKGYTPSNAQAGRDKEREELVGKIRDTKNNDYRYTNLIQQRIMKVTLEAERDGKPYGLIYDDLRALKVAMEGIRQGTANKWMVLGLDKENAEADLTLPELPIRELTPAEMMAMRDRQAVEDLDEDALQRLDDEPFPEDDGEYDIEVEGPPIETDEETEEA